ncbi:hypothetical protein BHE74_00033221 [Ensete ventricosum]|nr:hypothetical protein BHE74_00033221 [Ensete ventricosum]
MLWDYSATAEKLARLGPCRVRKLIHVSREWGRLIGVDSASQEPTPQVGFFGNCSGRCLPRWTCTKASSGWGYPTLLCFYHIAEEDTGDAEGSLVVEDSGRSGDKAMVETRVVVVAGEGDQVCGRQRRQGRLAEVEEGVEGSKAVEEEEGGSIDGSDRDNDATAWQ